MKRTPLIVMVLALLATLPTLTRGQDREAAAREDAARVRLAAEDPFAAVEAAEEASDAVEDAPADTVEDTADVPPIPRPAAEELPPGTLRFHLMDGSIITGKLETQTLPVKTEFGDLVVPITSIDSFAPGLASHPQLDQRIKQLIELLADPATERRDQAQAELVGFGSELIPELQRYADGDNTERKVRVVTIIEQLYAQEDQFVTDSGPSISLLQLDTVVTAQFTVAGRIQQNTFNIQSKFGKLVVRLADIKAAEKITAQTPELRRSLEVLGTDMAGTSYKDSGIRLNRGDRVIIKAEGRITLSPWGNNAVSNPDGMPQNGMYNGTIPFGALAGRIGDSGEEFLVGSNNSFVAQRSGTLYLGFAMQQNWSNYQFPGKYEARIRVVPAE